MALEVNGARGEVLINVGGEEVVIAATIGGLSVLSTRLECKSLHDLYLRLSGAEIAATSLAVTALAVRGDAGKAVSKMKLKHLPAIAEGIAEALKHHFDDDDEGNGEAAKTGE
ncbi:hypothetical protein F9K98_13305 [Brucella anthropi]|uniref:hypothetical protein n=1 Tax=Brucella anthropi TaxID=529 RepID=UPI00124EA5C8|nr:hypothetical protein [Brucella anthropi]KAB2762764.1 hypothetical protein F9K98_13305 [Brucella anthropi]